MLQTRWWWLALLACRNEEPPAATTPVAILDARSPPRDAASPPLDTPPVDAPTGVKPTPFVYEVRGRVNQNGIGRSFAAEGTTLLIGDLDDKSPDGYAGVFRILSLASGVPVEEAWFTSDSINRFGGQVAISNGTLIAEDNERVMVFEKAGGKWQRRDILRGQFWNAKPFLAIDGNTIVAKGDDISIYARFDRAWRRIASYTPKPLFFDVALGGEIVAVAVQDPFELHVLRRGKLAEKIKLGWSLDFGLAIAGERVAVGDRENVTIYQLPGGKVVGKIEATEDRKRGQYSWASFGTTLAWRGPMLVIGGERLGYVEIYCEREGKWQRSVRIVPPERHPQFGTQLALNGDLLWIGSPPIYEEGRIFEGALRAYRVTCSG